MVDDEHGAVGSGDAELFSVEADRADLWVVDGQVGAATWSDVVASPESSEVRAGEGELPDEVDEPGIVDVAADRLAEAGDRRCGGAFPVVEQGLLRVVEEQVAEAVGAGVQAG